jgi:hypothetical protein
VIFTIPPAEGVVGMFPQPDAKPTLQGPGLGVRALLWSLTGAPPPFSPKDWFYYVQAFARSVSTASLLSGPGQEMDQISDQMFPGPDDAPHGGLMALVSLFSVFHSQSDAHDTSSPFETSSPATEREAPRLPWWNFEITIAGGWGLESLSAALGVRSELAGQGLFFSRNFPEMSLLAYSLIESLLGRQAMLLMPLRLNLQEIVELLPLEESSLALTATLVTVPGQSAAGRLNESPLASTPEPLSPPPAWAGFVTGLDEAFEQNRRDVRQKALASTSSGANSPPALEASTVDEAIPGLDDEQAASPALDDWLLPESDASRAPAEVNYWDAAPAASVCVMLIPLWSTRRPRPARRRHRPRPS